MNLKKGYVIAGVVVVLGLAWLYLTMVGPWQNLNLGFGLTAGLSEVKLPGGYNMANLVMFIIFAVVLAVLGRYFLSSKDK